MHISSFRLITATAYAADRLLARAIHDEQVSVDAVVVLDAVIDHLLEEAPHLDLAGLAAETQLTGDQLQRALQVLETHGYLGELTTHAPTAIGLWLAAAPQVA
jgi:hypothetical protein